MLSRMKAWNWSELRSIAGRTIVVWAAITLTVLISGFALVLFTPSVPLWAIAATSGLLVVLVLHGWAAYKYFRGRWAAKQLTKFRDPEPDELAIAPSNVRIQWSTGHVTPVELVFLGKHGGLNCWGSTDPLVCPPGADPNGELKYDGVMPPGTAINLPVVQKVE